MNIQISRRDALLGSGALVVSFSLRGSLGGAQAQGAAKPLALTEVDSFLAIDKAGKVTVYSGKVDLGTGITTALRQIVAEELDVPTSRIELVQGDTSLTPDQGTTWGSLTIQVGGMQLRQAAAAARQALVAEAAKKLGTDQLTVTDGIVSGGGKKVSYGELIGGKNFADHARSQAAGEGKSAEGLQGRRQVATACRHSRQGHRPLHLHAGLQGARHVARPRGASTRNRRQARKR